MQTDIDKIILRNCFESREDYTQTILDLGDKLVAISDILNEHSPELLREEEEGFSLSRSLGFLPGDLELSAGIGQRISDWGGRIADRIRAEGGLSSNEIFQLLGPAFIRTFQADFIRQLLINMDIASVLAKSPRAEAWVIEIFTQGLLDIERREWPAIVDNWQGPVNHEFLHGATGCERVAEALTRGLAYQMSLGGVGKVGKGLGYLSQISKSTLGRTMIAMMSSDRVIKTTQQASIEGAMEIQEVQDFKRAMSEYLCSLDHPMELLLAPEKIAQYLPGIPGIGTDQDDDGGTEGCTAPQQRNIKTGNCCPPATPIYNASTETCEVAAPEECDPDTDPGCVSTDGSLLEEG